METKSQQKGQAKCGVKPESRSYLSVAATVFIHLLGVGLVAAVAGIVTLSFAGVHHLYVWQTTGGTFPYQEVALHLGISALFWFALWFVVQRFRTYKTPNRVRLAGSVMAETLIVMPAFFLIFIVLVQICLFNMLGMLASAAVHQAARTVWVWEPEIGVTTSEAAVKERAQIQAALVMLPMGQSGFIVEKLDQTSRLKSALSVVTAPHINKYRLSGNYAGEAMSDLASVQGSVDARSSFYRAFDNYSFKTRAPSKFLHAFKALEKSQLKLGGSEVGYELKYQYISPLPFWGLFTSYGKIDGNIVIERSFTFPRQSEPNRTLPN